jgi:hypothetical protein
VALNLVLKDKPHIYSANGFRLTNKKFIAKRAVWNRMIYELDNKPAVESYYSSLDWSLDLLNEKNFHRLNIFNPLGCIDEDNFIHPFVPGAFIGNNFITGCPIISEEVYVLDSSGIGLLSVVKEVFEKGENQNKINFFVSCASRLETLGSSTYTVRDSIQKFLDGPFLLIYTTGEHFYVPNQKIKNLELTFNRIAF